MGGVVAVGGADEPSIREPTDQHQEHLPQQFRRCLVPSPLPAVLFLGLIQGHQQGQGPSARGERQADQQGQHDPLVSPAECRERVGGADRVAMTALAIDLGTGMLRDGIITRQFDDILGRESSEDHLGESPRQMPAAPRTAREDAVITGGVPGGQGAQAAEQVADGMSAKGQDRGDGQEGETTVGRTCEGRSKGVEEGPHLLGQLLMVPVETASSLASLSGLLLSRNGVADRAAFGTAACGAGWLYWPWQPPCGDVRAIHTPHCTKEAHLCETQKTAKVELRLHVTDQSLGEDPPEQGSQPSPTSRSCVTLRDAQRHGLLIDRNPSTVNGPQPFFRTDP